MARCWSDRLSATIACRGWIHSFGPLARVVAPARLVQEIFNEIEQAREAYKRQMLRCCACRRRSASTSSRSRAGRGRCPDSRSPPRVGAGLCPAPYQPQVKSQLQRRRIARTC